MTRSPHHRDAAASRPQDELVLRLAADLRSVSGRVAELRALCVRQLNDLKSALQTITTIGRQISAEAGQVELVLQVGALVGEVASLHRRFEAQVAAGQRIADDFLLVAQEVEVEAASIRTGGVAQSSDGPILSLPAHRSGPENAAAARRRVEVISGSLRRLEAALTSLSEGQAQGVPELATLLARIAAFERQTAGSPSLTAP